MTGKAKGKEEALLSAKNKSEKNIVPCTGFEL